MRITLPQSSCLRSGPVSEPGFVFVVAKLFVLDKFGTPDSAQSLPCPFKAPSFKARCIQHRPNQLFIARSVRTALPRSKNIAGSVAAFASFRNLSVPMPIE
eukprot:11147632-Alexandrium_andersonii.AAC.1